MTRVATWFPALAAAWFGLATGCAPVGEGSPAARVAEIDPRASTASLTYFGADGPRQFEAAVGGEIRMQWLDGPDGAPELLLEEMALEIGPATVDGLTLHGAELWLAAPLSAALQDDGHVAFVREDTRFELSATVEIVTVEHELDCAHALQGIVEDEAGTLAWGVSAYTPGEPFAARLELAARVAPGK